ncbi:MAG TPA: TMEM175 family protein [Vicinamibacterales bacterium]|nr:TMEM175 family protein [Vicinamibacterales bacterium]
MVNLLRWRGHEVSRLEAFSDTVFAFALTLLVVALEVPRDYDKLVELMLGFPAFACCFALLIWIWSEHNTFFRRFGMQDTYTLVLNAVLLFVVLLYVYPLKFMFDSLFAGLLPARSDAPQRMQLYQLANASAIYAVGFMAVFVVFALLYHHAYRCRSALELTELEAFDARSAIGHHLVSTGVGTISLLIASVGPLELSPIAPMSFILMGPFHWMWGVRSRKRREAVEERLAGEIESAAGSAIPGS